MVTRPDEPIPDDVTEEHGDRPDRADDNEGAFVVDTDKLRVEPDPEE